MAFKVVETDSKVLPSIKSFRLSFLIYWASWKLFMLTYQIYAGDFGDRSSCEINESRWYSKSHHPSIPMIPEHITRTHTTQCIYSILFQILSITASFFFFCSFVLGMDAFTCPMLEQKIAKIFFSRWILTTNMLVNCYNIHGLTKLSSPNFYASLFQKT